MAGAWTLQMEIDRLGELWLTRRRAPACAAEPPVRILGPVDFRFYCDPATRQPHIWNHEVDEREVE